MQKEINQFCAQLGQDPLMVQGAGGNVSWKEDNALWVKASGTWLAHADKKDIFVPVNLPDLNKSIVAQRFDASPKLIGDHQLRPSIDTIFHALMPQIIVVHLHVV